MIRLIPQNLQFDFMSRVRPAVAVSLTLIVASICLVAFVGLNYGIDFKGGTDMIMQFEKDITAEEVREAAARAGFPDANVQRYGTDGRQFMVQTASVSVVNEPTVAKLKEDLAKVAAVERATWDVTQPDRMDVLFATVVTPEQIKAAVEPTVGKVEIEANNIDQVGKRFTIRFEDLQARVADGFAAALPGVFNPEKSIMRLETVGPRVGEQLRSSGVFSLLVSLLLILIYIAFRFDVRYAPGAVVALIHDVIISVGFFVVIDMEISLPIIAALLTIVGYSLNDTIVVFDRIRENLTDKGDADVARTINESISETLSRTIMTSLTTLLAVIAIIFFGGGLIEDFATALFIGICVGTYSSIFIASPVMLFMDRYLRTRRELQARSEAT
ncbi:MAG: protein translocase subunit SecF [bacterium]